MSSNVNMAKSGDVVGRKSVESSRHPTAREKFSFNALEYYLYGKNVVTAIDMQNIPRQGSSEGSGRERNNNSACSVCLGQKEGKCTTHAPLQSLRQLVHAEDHGTHGGGNIKATYAVLSFPDEVQLCTSSIPGAVYGVCARRHLPSGTWIGPYEGRRTVDQRYDASENRNYMWEIYTEGNFSHFIDGSDENSSSWMRFIRCARSKKEQNMVAYQCGQNIYYRSFRDIAMGEELLVWYSDSYQKHLEIPLCLKETDQAKIEELIGKTNDEELAVSVTVLNPQAADSVSFLPARSRPLPTETVVSHSNPEQHIVAQYRTEETALPYSSRSLEPVPPTVQQALADQIKKRIEKEKYIPSEEIEKKDAQEGLKLYELPQAETSDFQDFNTGSFVTQEGYKTTVPNDLSLPFKCRQCLKVFNQRIQLQMHVCPKSPYKPFQCGHCSLSFAQPSELRNHVVIHSSERPFKCGYCGRSFAGATTLNNHVRTHTGEKPFVCKSCGKTFAIATQLARHMRVSGECPGNASNTDRSKYASESLVEYD